jgi:hypothetical protein
MSHFPWFSSGKMGGPRLSVDEMEIIPWRNDLLQRSHSF